MSDTETWTQPEPAEPVSQSPLDAELSVMTTEKWSEVALTEDDLQLTEEVPIRTKEVPAIESHRQAIYLSALRRTGSRLVARRAACCTMGDQRRWASDLRFRDAEVDALRDTGELVIARAVQLGVEGTLEPVFQGGVCVGHKRKFSEKILIKLLEGFAKGRFGKVSETTTNNTVNVMATPEEMRALLQRLSPKRVEQSAKVIEVEPEKP